MFFTLSERRLFRRPPKIKPSEWCEKHRVLRLSSIPGKWRNSVTPYIPGIMDAADKPYVHEIAICAGPQTGKSESANNYVAFKTDVRPGPVMYVYPDEKTVKINYKGRLKPMFLDSPKLKSYTTGNPDDFSMDQINLAHMPVYFGWATSTASLANKPVECLIFDETDIFPPVVSKRVGSPVDQGMKRKNTFNRTYKAFFLSTPSTESGVIWQRLNDSDLIFDYHVRCPACNARQVMQFDQIKWKDSDPKKIEKEGAWYECEKCAARWLDQDRDGAVRNGAWLERKHKISLSAALKSHRPKSIGFHIPAWISPFIPFTEIAVAFVKSKNDPVKLRDFMNNYKAEPWKKYEKEREEAPILALCDDRPERIVPGGGVVACLTAGVDTQLHGFWYYIRAWGWGISHEGSIVQDSWLIRAGKVENFAGLAQVLWKDRYLDVDRHEYHVQYTVMDAMGGTQRQTKGVGTRTAEVYEFCSRHRGKIIAFKGEQRMAVPRRITNLEFYPNSNRVIPGGLKLLRADTTYYKNMMFNKLDVKPGDPGAYYFHAGFPEIYARHFTAEGLDPETGLYVQIRKENHLGDCGVYDMIANDYIGSKFWKKSAPEPPKQKKQQQLEEQSLFGSYA